MISQRLEFDIKVQAFAFILSCQHICQARKKNLYQTPKNKHETCKLKKKSERKLYQIIFFCLILIFLIFFDVQIETRAANAKNNVIFYAFQHFITIYFVHNFKFFPLFTNISIIKFICSVFSFHF